MHKHTFNWSASAYDWINKNINNNLMEQRDFEFEERIRVVTEWIEKHFTTATEPFTMKAECDFYQEHVYFANALRNLGYTVSLIKKKNKWKSVVEFVITKKVIAE